jgi:hypothetical protein
MLKVELSVVEASVSCTKSERKAFEAGQGKRSWFCFHGECLENLHGYACLLG